MDTVARLARSTSTVLRDLRGRESWWTRLRQWNEAQSLRLKLVGGETCLKERAIPGHVLTLVWGQAPGIKNSQREQGSQRKEHEGSTGHGDFKRGKNGGLLDSSE
eukprot:scaffold60824_cov23-Tisochrysis_lutea.AAC.1